MIAVPTGDFPWLAYYAGFRMVANSQHYSNPNTIHGICYDGCCLNFL